MKKKLLALVACVAWAGVAISSATPASARALTAQEGNYVACRNESSADSYYTSCDGEYSYSQALKFFNTACGAGGCQNSDTSVVYVEFLYTPGRKRVNYFPHCDPPPGMSVYNLGDCAC